MAFFAMQILFSFLSFFFFLQREAMSQHFPQFIAIELCKKYVYFQKILSS